MKLGIVIPLKSKFVSRDWGVINRNLEATLTSVISQRISCYHAAVVAHEMPDFFRDNLETRNCKLIIFDEFPPPVRGEDEMKDQLKFEFDRCSKILKGIAVLSKAHPDITHWFALDADDLVSSDFVDEIRKYQDADAIVLDKGYFYFKNTGVINISNEFSAYCGSSSILADHLIPSLPDTLDEKSFRLTPFGDISHVHMKKWLIDKGYSVSVPDERVIMYVRDNGENISNAAYCNTWLKKTKKFIKMAIRAKRVNKIIKRSFGLK